MEKLLHYAESNFQKLQELNAKMNSFEVQLSFAENGTRNRTVKAGLEHHRAGAYNLLLWPSVGLLLKAAGCQHNEEYVMNAECENDSTGFNDESALDLTGLRWLKSSISRNSNSRWSESYDAGILQVADLDLTSANTLYDSYTILSSLSARITRSST